MNWSKKRNPSDRDERLTEKITQVEVNDSRKGETLMTGGWTKSGICWLVQFLI